MSQEPITIAEYDPEWPAEYDAAASRIREAVGDRIAAVEHVGSTAVPGLAAKPIIDVMVGVETLADAEACVEPFERLGYEYCPEFEAEMPQRRYFRKTDAGRHTHHLHAVETTSEFWERHLLFRDYLRDHPDVARQYESRKRELAQAHRHDVGAYSEAKTPFIRAVEERARDHYDER